MRVPLVLFSDFGVLGGRQSGVRLATRKPRVSISARSQQSSKANLDGRSKIGAFNEVRPPLTPDPYGLFLSLSLRLLLLSLRAAPRHAARVPEK